MKLSTKEKIMKILYKWEGIKVVDIEVKERLSSIEQVGTEEQNVVPIENFEIKIEGFKIRKK